MENELALREVDMAAPLTAANIRAQVNLIQSVMREVMQGPSKENPEGVHYGIIPGCKKPSLLKPGAEKLFLTFRLRPIIDLVRDVIITEMPNGHRDYRVHCHIMSMAGMEMATGVGSASTMESKHRYRGGEKKSTGKPIPTAYWNLHKEGKDKEALALIGGPGFAPGKVDDKWVICEKGEKMENPDIADQYNTCLKMACKRAKVDGCLSATACSDIFTQDVEDFSRETGEPIGHKTAIPPQPSQPTQTAEELEAIRKQKAEDYAKANPAGKMAPPASKDAPAKPQAPSAGQKTATGAIIKHFEPKGKSSYHSFCVDGFDKMYFQASDKIMLETLLDKLKSGEVVTLDYTETQNGQYTNRLITGITVQQETQDVPF